MPNIERSCTDRQSLPCLTRYCDFIPAGDLDRVVVACLLLATYVPWISRFLPSLLDRQAPSGRSSKRRQTFPELAPAPPQG